MEYMPVSYTHLDVYKRQAFKWYEKGIKEGISLTRLYEYYLYALPKDYCYLLPKEVLLSLIHIYYGRDPVSR